MLRALRKSWESYKYRFVPWIALNLRHKRRSCSRRDQIGPLKLSDVFWLTTDMQNPLAVGQYVNNCSADKAANVCYQEFDVPESFPIEFKQYLPNINYSQEVQRSLRCVVLVALRNIESGEELFSNYYTIIH